MNLTPAQLKLAQARIRGAGVSDGAPEKQVMREIVATLKGLGFLRAVEWSPGKRCAGIYWRTGQRNARMGGNDEGQPDFTVVPFGRPAMFFEAKARTKDARVRPAQRVLAGLGITHIVSTPEEVLAIITGRTT